MDEMTKKKAAQALNVLFISLTLRVVLAVLQASGLVGLIAVILMLVGLQWLCNYVNKRFIPAWNLLMADFVLEFLMLLALGLISSRASETDWGPPAAVALLFAMPLVGQALSCLYMRIICLRTADLLIECDGADTAALAPQVVKIYWVSVAVCVLCSFLSLAVGGLHLIGTISQVLGLLVLAVFFQKAGKSLES